MGLGAGSGWGVTPEPSPAPLSPPRLDLSDIPNSVRLVAPDVGILLVSSLSLCLCGRLSPATSRRNLESPESPEWVRATPTAVGTSHHGDTPPGYPCPFPGHSLGLGMGTPPVSGPQFGAVLGSLEGLVIVTQLRVTQPWRSACVCSGIATGIVANRRVTGAGT